jgi:GNAT superfamily N-acetyltransferase
VTEELAEDAVADPVGRGMQEPDIRPARPEDLEACARVWHTSLNEYLVRLNQPEWPFDPAGITALYRHTQGTDPDRFLVAVRADPSAAAPDGERIVAFVSAVVRETHWFLSMLFVLPEEQASGIGRLLLERVLPSSDSGMTLATATDSAQPISNALYSRYGMIPRMPLLNLSGELRRPETLPDLPDGVSAQAFEDVVSGASDGTGHRELASIVNTLDRRTLGVEHAQDHAWLRVAGRRGFVYRSTAGEVLGYGYGSELGRIGPIAVHDPDLMAPILGHLLRTFQPRGAFAVWTPGAAGDCVRLLLAAGLRLEPFPILLCWDASVTDYSRYLPISPGLL